MKHIFSPHSPSARRRCVASVLFLLSTFAVIPAQASILQWGKGNRAAVKFWTAKDIIAVGSGTAVRSDGTVWVYGADITPRRVLGVSNIITATNGNAHGLALKSDGTVWAWGGNIYGQVGNGFNADVLRPYQVPGMTTVIAVSAGPQYVHALKSDGTVWAWGRNHIGQLGIGTNSNLWEWPRQVLNLSGITAISAGRNYGTALKSDGTVWTWGINVTGQLGSGNTTARNRAAQIPDLTGVTAIQASDSHVLALRTNGTVLAWGRNLEGQLGDGTLTNRLSPITVLNAEGTPLTGVARIMADYDGSFAEVPANSTLTGVVELQGLAANATREVTFQFEDSNGNVMDTQTVALGASGAYSFPVEADTFSFLLSSPYYLAQRKSLDAAGVGTTLNGLLRAGDANLDNTADIADLILLISHYNAVSPSGNYLEAADFNADGSNDISDLSLLIVNYNTLGDL